MKTRPKPKPNTVLDLQMDTKNSYRHDKTSHSLNHINFKTQNTKPSNQKFKSLGWKSPKNPKRDTFPLFPITQIYPLFCQINASQETNRGKWSLLLFFLDLTLSTKENQISLLLSESANLQNHTYNKRRKINYFWNGKFTRNCQKKYPLD